MRLIYIIAVIVFWSSCLHTQITSMQNFSGGSSFRILFLGDLDFGESYQTNPRYNRGVNIIDEYGYEYMFENIRGLLRNSNLTIANLETTLTDSVFTETLSRKPYIHWSYASKTVNYLQKYFITALSLANNHTLDFGTGGLNQTIGAFKNNMFVCFGAGINLEEASKPFISRFISNPDTLTIAVLSGFEYRKSYDSLYNFYAKENSPGVNVISIERIKEQIKELRNKYSNIFIIFFPHWGRNYLWKTEKQTETAHQLIDAGIDLIIGTGSHTVQEVENYKHRWIVYGIGNSVFNAPGRYKYFNAKPYSFIAELIMRSNPEDNEKQLRLYPLFTDNLETDYQVRFLNSDEMNDCYSILRDKCQDKKIFKDEFKLKENDLLSFFEIQLN